MLYKVGFIFIYFFFYLEDNIDETYGINVQFEESEEEDDEDVYGEIREGDDHEDEGEESKLDATIHAENVSYFIIFHNLFKQEIIYSWTSVL